jgi:hypothetical protein
MKLIKLSVLALAALSLVCASCAKKQAASAPAPGYVEYGK